MTDSRKQFEAEYLGGGKMFAGRDSTTGDYVVPFIRDAYAGWSARDSEVERLREALKEAVHQLDLSEGRLMTFDAMNRRDLPVNDDLLERIRAAQILARTALSSKEPGNV